MTTKLLNSSVAGYYLNPKYDALTITHLGYVGSPGVNTTSSQASTIGVLGNVTGSDWGIRLADGGTVTIGNASNTNVTVTADNNAIIGYGPGEMVVNHGVLDTINGTVAIFLRQGGTVHNTGDAGTGISIVQGTGYVVNSGTVAGQTNTFSYNGTTETYVAAAITLDSGGSVINQAGGVVKGGGISIQDGGGSIRNAGDVYASTIREVTATSDITLTNFGIFLLGGGTVANSGSVYGGVETVVSAATVANSGTIFGQSLFKVSSGLTYRNGYAVDMNGGGTLTNTGTIYNGIYIGEGGTVVNQGDVAELYLPNAQDPYSIELSHGGTVINGSSTATATIDGGIKIVYGAGSIINAGRMTGAVAIALDDGGTIISGAATNGATYIGGGATGVFLEAGGTLTNFGTIEGSSYAVKILSTAGTLIEEGSGTLTGSVNGGGNSMLELGAKAGAGTLKGLGSTVHGFKTVTVDALADWTLSTTHIVTGTTLTDLGTLTLKGGLTNDGEIDLGGSAGNEIGSSDRSTLSNDDLLKKTVGGTSVISTALVNTGTVEVANGELDLDGAINGTGMLQIDSGQRLELGSPVAKAQTVDFDGTGDWLTLGNARRFAGSLSGFASSDQLILMGFDTNATLGFVENKADTGGKLTVTDGALTATIALLGQYAAAGFGIHSLTGGEVVTYTPPASPGVVDHLSAPIG